MEPRSFSQQLRDGGGLLGSWCSFASFSSVEVMTELGFDFLVLDMQHTEISQAQFPSFFGAFREPKPVAVVRAPSNDYHIVNWLFDQGAGAVLVPMVNSPQEARRAVEAAKYPPLGKRSFGPYRAARYSFGVDAYMPRADALATLIVQIESEEAVRHIDEILALPGIDAVFMGPNDLAFSMLRKGQPFFGSQASRGGEGSSQWTGFARTPEMLELCEHVLSRSKAAGVPFGMTAAAIGEAREWLAKGAAFMTYGGDFLFLRAGAKHLCGR